MIIASDVKSNRLFEDEIGIEFYKTKNFDSLVEIFKDCLQNQIEKLYNIQNKIYPLEKICLGRKEPIKFILFLKKSVCSSTG